MTPSFIHPAPSPWLWLLNGSLLCDPSIASGLKRALDLYFCTNTNSDTLPHTVWNAHESYRGGIFIKHGSHLNKKRHQGVSAHLPQVNKQETPKKRNPSMDFNFLRNQLKTLYSAKAILTKCRCSFYEYGKRHRKSMITSLLIKKQETLIPAITTSVGIQTSLVTEIVNFLRVLYDTTSPLTYRPSTTNA